MSTTLDRLAGMLGTDDRPRSFHEQVAHLAATVPGMTPQQARQCLERERGNRMRAWQHLVREQGMDPEAATAALSSMSSAERVALYRSAPPHRASTWRWHPGRGRLMEVEHHDWHDWRFVATGEQVAT